MIFLLSPSKSQNFSIKNPENFTPFISPSSYMKESEKLVEIYKKFSSEDLQKIFSVSEKIADLNKKRFQTWSIHPEDKNTAPAITAFTGTVYNGFEYQKYNKEQCQYAHTNLKIISGLYGIISPFALIQPYRLEMGTRLAFDIEGKKYKNLYDFWQQQLTKDVIEEMQKNDQTTLINLASQEYAKVLDKNLLHKNNVSVTEVDFKTKKNGKLKIIAIYAKKQRGKIMNWCIENQASSVDELKEYTSDGFVFSEEESKDGRICFVG